MKWQVIVPLVVYLVLMLAIGYFAFTRRRTAASGAKSEQYYLGGRSIGWVVLVFTLLASAASAGTFIGGPGLAYKGGYGWVLVSMFQVPTAFLALGMLGKKFSIVARKLNAMTVPDFLRHRYENPIVVVVASVGVVLFLMAYMVAQFVGGARVLQPVTGVPYTWLVIIFAGVVAIYTCFGGFLADAFSDTAQGIIMLLGGIALWIAIFVVIGGMHPVSQTLVHQDPGLLTLPGPGGFTPRMIATYSLQLGLFFCAVPHLTVRAMSYRDTAAMHKAMYIGPIIMTIFTLGYLCIGPVARVVYPDLDVGDLAVPKMIIHVLPDWFAGMLLAAPLAAVMSTVDSMILVVSSAIVRDLYKNYVNPKLSDGRASIAGSAVSFILGVIVLVLALNPPAYLEYLIIFAIGGLEAVYFVPLLFGLYWKRGNTLGAILGMVGGLGWYAVATQLAPSIALGMFPIATSAAVAIVLYVLGSYLGRPPRTAVLVKFWGTQEEIDRWWTDPLLIGSPGERT
ncbi:MAG: sodium/pantothenate symporter [Streptosporangiales bacterium]